MEQTEFETLAMAAYKGERAAARRLAARLQLSEPQALLQVLTLAAGTAGLAQLLAERARLRQHDANRRAARQAAAAHELALRQAARQPAGGMSGGWHGWFDGSAHPNPGQIGIGALLRGPDGLQVEISRRAGYGNSSEAEYLALTALLQAAVAHGARGLVIHGDSQVVINDVNLSTQAIAAGRGATGLEELRAGVVELMSALGAVQLRWVPRHRNGDADRLSQQAVSGLSAEH
jgi:ribonuclease HI